jgi:hypothetical protein
MSSWPSRTQRAMTVEMALMGGEAAINIGGRGPANNYFALAPDL